MSRWRKPRGVNISPKRSRPAFMDMSPVRPNSRVAEYPNGRTVLLDSLKGCTYTVGKYPNARCGVRPNSRVYERPNGAQQMQHIGKLILDNLLFFSLLWNHEVILVRR